MNCWEALFYCVVYGLCVPIMAGAWRAACQIILTCGVWHTSVHHAASVACLDAVIQQSYPTLMASAGLCQTESGAWRPACGWHVARVSRQLLLLCRREHSFDMYALSKIRISFPPALN